MAAEATLKLLLLGEDRSASKALKDVGDGLHWFSVAMFVGVFVGTYSSIYIGTAFALWRGLNRQDFIVQVKPEFEEEEIP